MKLWIVNGNEVWGSTPDDARAAAVRQGLIPPAMRCPVTPAHDSGLAVTKAGAAALSKASKAPKAGRGR